VKKDLTEIGVVIDRSGSMALVASDAIGGFNTFLKSQQEQPGDANMTVLLFNEAITKYATNAPVKGVAPLTSETYVAQGWTALYDAVGTLIDEIGEKLAKTSEDSRPEKVIIAILTDGAENKSRMYTQKMVFDKIALQRDTYNWEFIFLAAGEEAFKEGQALGMSMSKMAKFANDSAGNSGAYETLCLYTSAIRSTKSFAETEQLKSAVNLQSMVDENIAKATVTP